MLLFGKREHRDNRIQLHFDDALRKEGIAVSVCYVMKLLTTVWTTLCSCFLGSISADQCGYLRRTADISSFCDDEFCILKSQFQLQSSYTDVMNQRQFCKPRHNATRSELQVLLLQTPADRQSLFDFLRAK